MPRARACCWKSYPDSRDITVEGKPPRPDEERIEVTYDIVTPGYFQAVGTRVLRGRDIGAEARADGVPVAIINEAMARRYWPAEDPVGKRFTFGGPDSENWFTVVGVAGDARRTAPDREARPSVYLVQRQFPQSNMMLLVRSAGDPVRLAGAVALLACYVPARRATRVDPAVALRAEG